jgi:hypothetical protein
VGSILQLGPERITIDRAEGFRHGITVFLHEYTYHGCVKYYSEHYKCSDRGHRSSADFPFGGNSAMLESQKVRWWQSPPVNIDLRPRAKVFLTPEKQPEPLTLRLGASAGQ